MGFSLSPSVTVTETDLTLYVPNVATSIGSLVGFTQWGPVDEILTVSNEKTFVARYGQPDDDNYRDWFSAFNFLAYSNNLKMVRVVDGTVALNSAAGVKAAATVTGTDLTYEAAGKTITTAGAGGIDFSVFGDGQTITITTSVSNDGTYTIVGAPSATVITVVEALIDEGTADAPGVITVTNPTGIFDTGTSTAHLIKNSTSYEVDEAAIIATGNGALGKYPGKFGDDLLVSVCDAATWGSTTWPDGLGTAVPWDYQGYFNVAPEGDEVYAVVALNGSVVETFIGSKDPAAKDPITSGNGSLKEIINRTSQYIWIVVENLFSGTPGSYTDVQFEGLLSGGLDGYADSATSDDERAFGWDLMNDTELLDINFCITANASPIAGQYVIENIAEVRKDCVAYVSPVWDDVVGSLTPITDMDTTRQQFGSSSYAVMDGNYKYQYDKYNDKYRWVPLNGDIAGLCAFTDVVKDPWWSPAGLNRGGVKNVTKLALNPTKTQRDDLYRIAINPVVIFRGEGAVLFGDKTLQTKPSAFDRINVRRLFIVLEKAIATAAKYMLFEFNDADTRSQFTTLVEPFLRNVKARRGVYDYKVVCDETNNTPEVIDRNEFVGDIYIKPTKSINFIYLNFVAVSSAVTFDEVLLGR